mmetsp:Transcript_29380/g.94302  ORF Transcript_29380/g.94302 Transcript_29380/m.94302 type:complete len:251 (-) Transcript_29380:746-1498(-)
MSMVLPMTSGEYRGLLSLVVKKSLKPSSQSTTLSPSLMALLPFCSMMSFSSTGSSIGSSSSSMFSKRNGLPNWMASSRCFMKSESFSDFTVRFSSAKVFLIHATACCCGSMHSGKRLLCIVMMPFCTEWSSAGRPLAVQPWTVASFTSIELSCRSSVSGMPLSTMVGQKFWVSSSWRNELVNAPVYDRNDADSRQLPTSSAFWELSRATSAVQRVRSPVRPEMSLFAALRRFSMSPAWYCRSFSSPLAAA